MVWALLYLHIGTAFVISSRSQFHLCEVWLGVTQTKLRERGELSSVLASCTEEASG